MKSSLSLEPRINLGKLVIIEEVRINSKAIIINYKYILLGNIVKKQYQAI